jgi:hypothetical protein
VFWTGSSILPHLHHFLFTRSAAFAAARRVAMRLDALCYVRRCGTGGRGTLAEGWGFDMDLSKLSQNEKLAMYGAAAVVIGGLVGYSYGLTVLAVLAALAALAIIFLPQLSPSTSLPGSRGSLLLIAGGVAAAVMALALVMYLSVIFTNFNLRDLFFLVAAAGAIVLAWAGWQELQREGGTFKVGAAGAGSDASAAAGAAAASTPPPDPASTASTPPPAPSSAAPAPTPATEAVQPAPVETTAVPAAAPPAAAPAPPDPIAPAPETADVPTTTDDTAERPPA